MDPLGVPLARCAQAEDLVPPLVQTVSPVAAQVSVSRATCALRDPPMPRQSCVGWVSTAWQELVRVPTAVQVPMAAARDCRQMAVAGCVQRVVSGRLAVCRRHYVRAHAELGMRVRLGPPTRLQLCVPQGSTAPVGLAAARRVRPRRHSQVRGVEAAMQRAPTQRGPLGWTWLVWRAPTRASSPSRVHRLGPLQMPPVWPWEAGLTY